MKITITFVLLFSVNILLGQQIDSLGIDNNDTLNKSELDYFNPFSASIDVHYNNLRIAFISGKPEVKIISKREFIDTYIRPAISNDSLPHMSMFGLSKKEKKQSGGYDFIFVSPSVGVKTKKVFKQLKQQANKGH